VQKQFQDAKDAIPNELKPKDENGDVIEEKTEEGNNRPLVVQLHDLRRVRLTSTQQKRSLGAPFFMGSMRCAPGMSPAKLAPFAERSSPCFVYYSGSPLLPLRCGSGAIQSQACPSPRRAGSGPMALRPLRRAPARDRALSFTTVVLQPGTLSKAQAQFSAAD
jgi:hypothetical protein